MLAQVGDRIVLEPNQFGDARRSGIVTAVTHADGGPPYEVRWPDEDRTTLIFPGLGSPHYPGSL
ncbi:DUF1918 domain-containing protein [Paractinoplanes rishiriensis]|uniref:DUF1918 domain-containing protein n=1 Tax=Paractinoplanes rishiriensis TaxID=1050105 RepID=A0A919KD98_9ACTN|nr:DUF1918 domain-containing protein [Actinoplanes rishiriensis]GIF02057.1 hypothetical protein Ari01nite_95210 [Actinoplanes rishiriensis]